MKFRLHGFLGVFIVSFFASSLAAGDIDLLLEKLNQQESFFQEEPFCNVETFSDDKEKKLAEHFLKKLEEQKELVQKEFESYGMRSAERLAQMVLYVKDVYFSLRAKFVVFQLSDDDLGLSSEKALDKAPITDDDEHKVLVYTMVEVIDHIQEGVPTNDELNDYLKTILARIKAEGKVIRFLAKLSSYMVGDIPTDSMFMKLRMGVFKEDLYGLTWRLSPTIDIPHKDIYQFLQESQLFEKHFFPLLKSMREYVRPEGFDEKTPEERLKIVRAHESDVVKRAQPVQDLLQELYKKLNIEEVSCKELFERGGKDQYFLLGLKLCSLYLEVRIQKIKDERKKLEGMVIEHRKKAQEAEQRKVQEERKEERRKKKLEEIGDDRAWQKAYLDFEDLSKEGQGFSLLEPYAQDNNDFARSLNEFKTLTSLYVQSGTLDKHQAYELNAAAHAIENLQEKIRKQKTLYAKYFGTTDIELTLDRMLGVKNVIVDKVTKGSTYEGVSPQKSKQVLEQFIQSLHTMAESYPGQMRELVGDCITKNFSHKMLTRFTGSDVIGLSRKVRDLVAKGFAIYQDPLLGGFIETLFSLMSDGLVREKITAVYKILTPQKEELAQRDIEKWKDIMLSEINYIENTKFVSQQEAIDVIADVRALKTDGADHQAFKNTVRKVISLYRTALRSARRGQQPGVAMQQEEKTREPQAAPKPAPVRRPQGPRTVMFLGRPIAIPQGSSAPSATPFQKPGERPHIRFR